VEQSGGAHNNMTGICFPNESFYTDVRVQNYILDNFEGVLFAGNRQGYEFYLANKDKLKKSMSLNGSVSVVDKKLRVYSDEPISNPNFDNIYLKGIIDKYPNAIIGELEKDIMLELAKKYPNISLTYTAYKDLLFKICSKRFYKWWGNQLETWKWMNKEFGNRFNVVWINFNQMNDKKLFKWAKMHNKEIWIYVEENLILEQFLNKIKGM